MTNCVGYDKLLFQERYLSSESNVSGVRITVVRGPCCAIQMFVHRAQVGGCICGTLVTWYCPESPVIRLDFWVTIINPASVSLFVIFGQILQHLHTVDFVLGRH